MSRYSRERPRSITRSATATPPPTWTASLEYPFPPALSGSQPSCPQDHLESLHEVVMLSPSRPTKHSPWGWSAGDSNGLRSCESMSFSDFPGAVAFVLESSSELTAPLHQVGQATDCCSSRSEMLDCFVNTDCICLCTLQPTVFRNGSTI